MPEENNNQELPQEVQDLPEESIELPIEEEQVAEDRNQVNVYRINTQAALKGRG